MTLIFNTGILEAIWVLDCFGDGFEDKTLDSLKGSYDSLFFYFEDYCNYTAIHDGMYIINGYDNDVKIGDWLVEIKVFDSTGNVKAIECHYIDAVKIFKEVNSTGADGLDEVICYYKKTNSKKIT